MKLLTPLGIIALIGLVVLLLIYIIKPTYQSKVLSSTFIWHESLKYKTGRKPMSKLQNILRVICQVLIISDCALMLATPMIIGAETNLPKENVVILDGSANMLYEKDGVTRFDSAKAQIEDFAEESLKRQEKMTVIYAGQKAEYVTLKDSSLDSIKDKVSKLKCTYMECDYYGALALARELTDENPNSNVYYYTSTKIAAPGDINVIDMSGGEDWNAGILAVNTTFEENYFQFYVDVATYGDNKYVNVFITVNNINGTTDSKTAKTRVNCLDGKISKASFRDMEVYSYSDATVVIKADDGSSDGFIYDDTFTLLDGKKEQIDIQYYSTRPNNFIKSSLMTIKNSYNDTYDINITTKSPKDLSESIKYSGLDIYIFEHEVPITIPTDGVVILINPDTVPTNLKDISLESGGMGDFKLNSDSTNPIMSHVNADQITVSTYKKIISSSFEHLMFCGNDSVLAVKNTAEEKVAVMTVDLNRSNFPLLLDFPLMLHNMFDYFSPRTIEKATYDVGEKIKVTSRGTEVNFIDTEGNKTPITTPTELVENAPGKYSIEQKLIDGSTVTRDLYVKIPQSESNVIDVNNALEPALEIPELQESQTDILMYLACALIALIILERFLYSKENI